LCKCDPEQIYGSLILNQYVESLEEFYEDFNNIAIPIAAAMTIVKKKIDGEPKETMEKYIISLREKFSEKEEMQQNI